MKTILVFLLVSTSSIWAQTNISVNEHSRIDETCFWENSNRKVISKIENEMAEVSSNGVDYILLINNSQYFPCNLPSTMYKKGLRLKISGIVFSTFQTEKVIATPLKLTSVEYISK